MFHCLMRDADAPLRACNNEATPAQAAPITARVMTVARLNNQSISVARSRIP